MLQAAPAVWARQHRPRPGMQRGRFVCAVIGCCDDSWGAGRKHTARPYGLPSAVWRPYAVCLLPLPGNASVDRCLRCSAIPSCRLVKWYSSSWKNYLSATERHLPYGITQCYTFSVTACHRTPVNAPRRNPTRQLRQAGTRFIYSGGMRGWVGLRVGYIISRWFTCPFRPTEKPPMDGFARNFAQGIVSQTLSLVLNSVSISSEVWELRRVEFCHSHWLSRSPLTQDCDTNLFL